MIATSACITCAIAIFCLRNPLSSPILCSLASLAPRNVGLDEGREFVRRCAMVWSAITPPPWLPTMGGCLNRMPPALGQDAPVDFAATAGRHRNDVANRLARIHGLGDRSRISAACSWRPKRLSACATPPFYGVSRDCAGKEVCRHSCEQERVAFF